MHINQTFLKVFAVVLNISLVAFSATEAQAVDSVTKQAEVAANNMFPVAISSRPFTLPAGSFEVATSLGGSLSDKSMGSDLRLSLGINDDLQLDVTYGGMSWMDVTPTQSMSVGVGYFTYANDFMASMASLSVPLDFGADHVAQSVSFAAFTVFGLGNGFGIHAFYENLVDFHFRPATHGDAEWTGMYADFNLPVRLAYQASDEVYLGLSTNLATLHTNKAQEYIWDVTPIKLAAAYSFSNAVDLGVWVGFTDVKDANTFNGGIGFSVRGGALNG